MALEREMKTYSDHLVDLVAHAGKCVLIKGDVIDGTFDTYSDALKAGYEKHKLEPFLVKQIAPSERMMSFTRDYEFACLP